MIKPLQFQNVNFCGAKNNEDNNKKTGMPDVSGKIDEFNREATEVTDSVAQTTETVTRAVGQVGTSAVGIWAILKNPIKSTIDFFSKNVKDANGNVVMQDVIDKKTGQKVLDEAGKVVQEAVKTTDWKKLGIAGAILTSVVTAIGIGVAVKKNNAKKEIKIEDSFERTQNVQKAPEKVEEAEESKETEE